MLAWTRRHLSFANVVSVIALFLALGGTGYAALTLPKNSVGSKQLKRGAVTPKKVAKKTLRMFRGQRGAQGIPGLPGPPGEPNPNAANSQLLDGLDSTEFLRGHGRVLNRVFQTSALADDDAGPVLDLPKFGRVGYICGGDGVQLDYLNTTNAAVRLFRANGRFPSGGADDDDPTYAQPNPGVGVAASPAAPVESLRATWMLSPVDEPDATARIEVFSIRQGGSICLFAADALVIDP